MAHNFLEQLVAEWYEYQGFFIRRNVLVGRRSKGGHECELDVLAFNPNTRTVVHIEPSMDAQSWADREKRYKKKFDAGRKHIPRIFESLGGVEQIQQIAPFVFASDKTHQQIGGGQILLVQHLRKRPTNPSQPSAAEGDGEGGG